MDVNFEYDEDNLYEEGDDSHLAEDGEEEWSQLMHPHTNQHIMQEQGAAHSQHMTHHSGHQTASQGGSYSMPAGVNYANSTSHYIPEGGSYSSIPPAGTNYYAANTAAQSLTKSPHNVAAAETLNDNQNGKSHSQNEYNYYRGSESTFATEKKEQNYNFNNQPPPSVNKANAQFLKNLHKLTHQGPRELNNKNTDSTQTKKRAGPYSKTKMETTEKNSSQSEPQASNTVLNKITQARNELKNLRQSVRGLRSLHKTDVTHLEGLLEYASSDKKQLDNPATPQDAAGVPDKDASKKKPRHDPIFENWKPIGFMESAYLHKNGTPRQGCLVQESRGRIRVLDALYTNPQHSLQGLDQYSHVWLVFAFDQNSDSEGGAKSHSKAKVAPPRLGGAKLGVFATRSPHRPNPVGLTLAKLDAVEGSTVHVSGIDILYGTPILDIKPYIPQYDAPVSGPPITRQDIMKEVMRGSATTCNEDAEEDGADLDGSYLCAKDGRDDKSTATPNKQTPSKGIEITKVKCAENYDHLLSKISGLNTNGDHFSQHEPLNNGNSKLTSSEQINNAKNLDTSDLIELNKTNKQPKDEEMPLSDDREVRTADWLATADSRQLHVLFNPIAEKQIKQFSTTAHDEKYMLSFCKDSSELRALIESGVKSDPRSSYRRNKCPDLLHHYTADTARVSCVFLDAGSVEVLRVAPLQS